MPSYKLLYFNNRGRAESSRLLFVLASQPFQDVRVDDAEWFSTDSPTKQSCPLGQIPVLQIDSGKMIPQSRAIESYLASEFGFNGSTNLETFQIDVISDTIVDLMHLLGIILFYTKDPKQQAEQLKDYYDNKAPPFIKALNSFLEENAGGDGWMVGDKITLADLAVFNGLDTCFTNHQDLLTNYPKLVTLRDKVANHPRIAEYLKTRPVTLF